MTTLYAMTVDAEEEWDWNSGWPTGRPSVENIRRLTRFQDLCSGLGVATTYFTNWSVIDDSEARKTLLRLAGTGGVEIGMHIHPWNTPPLRGSGPVLNRETYLHNLEPGVAREKLERVHEGFANLGLAPTSFRGGRFSSGRLCQQFLRDAGFLADSSPIAYTRWNQDGSPDYVRRGPEPTRLAARDSGGPLWEVPVTRGFTRRPERLWRRCFASADGGRLRHLRLIGLAAKLGIVRRVLLSFDRCDDEVIPFLRHLRRLQPSCICFILHSSSLLAGGNPYTRTEADVDRLFGHMEEVFRTLAGWSDFQPATITEIARKLEDDYAAKSRPSLERAPLLTRVDREQRETTGASDG